MKNIKISSIVCLVAVLVNFFAFSNTAYAAPAITVVDLTSLATGAETSHDCNKYITTKYDASQHWQECTVCGKIVGSKSNHNFTTIGTAGCNAGLGYQYRQCSCGYGYKLDKVAHSDSGSWIACSDRHGHYQYCTECHIWSQYGNCVNASGQRLGCSTGISGTCVVCHAYRDGSKHGVIVCSQTGYQVAGTTIAISGNLVCRDCGTKFGEYSVKTYKVSDTQSKAVLDATTNFGIPTVSMGAGNCDSIAQNGVTFEVTNLSQSGNNIHSEAVVNYTSSILAPAEYELHFATNSFSNAAFVGGSTYIHMGGTFRADWDAPSYSSSDVNYYSYVNGYATRAILNAKYYEGYSNECYIRLLDSDGETVISNWGSATKDDSFFSLAIDITDEVTGDKTLYLQAKDTFGNTSALTAITVSNLDSKAPTQTSSIETSQNWSKTKDFKFTATDEGAGNVQIAFNNVNDYMLATRSGNAYSRNYRFTGDVYGSVTAAVYYKDAVGNETTKFIKVHNLDNTAPNIQTTEKILLGDKVKIMVTANDINTALNASGSGVNGYAITTSSNIPALSSFQSTNGLEVIKNGIYYVWAKDAVGNISRYKMVKVTELVADYTVNHFKQDVYGNYPTIPDETYKTKGDIGTSVTPPINKYEGFISPVTQTIIIKADGSSKVNYYYERTKVTLDINGEYLIKQYVDQLDSEAQKKYYSNLGISQADADNNMGTFDMYINNILVADDVRDYYNDQILYGSTWEIRDIKPDAGKHYYGAEVN